MVAVVVVLDTLTYIAAAGGPLGMFPIIVGLIVYWR